MHIDRLKQLIEKVVEYNWNDELADYVLNCSDEPGGNARDGHIFQTLVELDNFITEGPPSRPEDHFHVLLGVKQPAPKPVTAESLLNLYGDDGEHPHYDRERWRQAVVCDETIAGYWEWVADQCNNNAENV